MIHAEFGPHDTRGSIAVQAKWTNTKAQARLVEAAEAFDRYPDWVESKVVHTENLGGPNPKMTFTCSGTPVGVKALGCVASAHSFRLTYEHEAAHMIILVVNEEDEIDWVQGCLLRELKEFMKRHSHISG